MEGLYGIDDDRETRKRKLDEYMNSLPCSGCWHKAHPNAPIHDIAVKCKTCGYLPMSSSYSHTCKTGWRNPVCETCNNKINVALDD